MKYYNLSQSEIIEAIKALTDVCKIQIGDLNVANAANTKLAELINLIDTTPLNPQ